LIKPPVPPLGVFIVADMGLDMLINVILTLLGFVPGLLHAFYLQHVYCERKLSIEKGDVPTRRAWGIFSDQVQ
ncbi:hypothetical protein P280DRAFT_363837, partial [Massarina eburnea CBS 473.64]